MASRLNRWRPKERRQHARYRVDLPATFLQVSSKTTIVPGEFGQLLINLPNGITPLAMSHALVRWVSGQECGLEFIRMDLDDKGRLNRLTGQLGGGNPFS